MTKTTIFPILFVLPILGAFAACSSSPSAASGENPGGGEPTGNSAKPSGEQKGPTGSSEDGGKSDASSGSEPESRGTGQYEVYFWDTTMHTGFDGTHPYQLAAVVFLDNPEGNLAKFETPPEVTVDNPAILEVKPIAEPPEAKEDDFIGGQWFSFVAKSAGTAKVTVKYKDLTDTATVQVTQYTPQEWEAGRLRYTAPPNPGATRSACVTCHTAAEGKIAAPKHGPFYQSIISDGEIVGLIKTGQTPEYVLDGVTGGHKWDLTPVEEKGIVAYLRSLNPFGGAK